MSEENRGGGKPIPDNLQQVLNELQLLALRRIEGFGWDLRFVRQQNSKCPIPVVSNAEGNTIGVLEDDGRVNMDYEIKLRG